MSSIIVFFAQAFYVFLLGFQSRNVRDGQYAMAAATSLTLGIFGLINQVLVIRSTIASDWLPLIAYVAAGPVGICLAIRAHDAVTSGRTSVADEQS